jgi:hypothetical protein
MIQNSGAHSTDALTRSSIATGSGGKFVWTPENLPSGKYALRIKDTTADPNFSVFFQYEGTGTLSSSVSSSARSTSSAPTSTVTSVSSTVTSASTTTSSTSTRSEFSLSLLFPYCFTDELLPASTSATTSNTSRPSNTNNSPKNKSPLAFVLVTVATFVYFH